MDAEISSTEVSLLDLSRSERIPILLELVHQLSSAATPQDVLSIFSSGLQQLDAPAGYISLSTRGLAPGQYKVTRFLTDEGFSALGDSDTWGTRRDIPIQSGGILGDIVNRGTPAIYENLNIANDPVLGDRLAGYRSLMAMPLYDNGEVLNWAIPLRRDPRAFTVEAMEEGLLRANLVGGTVRHVQTANELRHAHETIQHEVRRIAAIQRALLPETLPLIKGVSVAASFDTFDQAGGDLYDVRPVAGMHEVDEPVWGFFIGDASGHGPSAAVVMAMLHAILATYLETTDCPGEFVAHANRQLCAKRIEQSFVTAILGVYLEDSRKFIYARAGHNPALLLRDGRTTVLDEVGDLPLGIEPDIVYEAAEVQLQPGDVVVMYTDGWVEGRSPRGEDFGEPRFREFLHQLKNTEPQHIIHTLQEALWDFQGTRSGMDDQTLLVFRVDQ
jgi:sigma-B regulation protein RsbU (phosphoserine phosphatase)